jgi:transcriptional regulator with XRE-family HTH domain
MSALDPGTDPRGLLGKLLREARSESGKSGEALARAIGQEKTGVVRAESGERVPTLPTLGAWLDECGVAGLAEAALRGIWKLARNVENPAQAQLAPWYATEARAHPAVLAAHRHPRPAPGRAVRLRDVPRDGPRSRAGTGRHRGTHGTTGHLEP